MTNTWIGNRGQLSELTRSRTQLPDKGVGVGTTTIAAGCGNLHSAPYILSPRGSESDANGNSQVVKVTCCVPEMMEPIGERPGSHSEQHASFKPAWCHLPSI